MIYLSSNYIKVFKTDAMTTQEASHNLDRLIDRIIDNVQPTILCNDRGNKAILISLDEFSTWQETLYLLSLDEFSTWQETLYLLSTPFNAKHLLDSIQSAKAGQTIEIERRSP